MREQKFGRIILTSSVLAERPLAGIGVYSACKAFSDTIVKAVAIENAKYGITCNSMQLGYFNGGLVDHIPKPLKHTILEFIPMKRWLMIEEIENTIMYIMNNPYLTGTTIRINGGLA